MDSGQLSVDPKRLLETSDLIARSIASIQSQLDTLEQDAAPLVQTWAGDAQAAYLQRQQTWRQASTELATMLQAIKRGLDDSVTEYQTTEKRNVNLFAG